MAVQVGLENLVYSILQTDVKGGTATYEPPISIAPAITAKISPKVNSVNLYGDNGVVATLTNMEQIDVELETSEFPLEVQADLLGHTIDKGVMVKKSTDFAPYVALGFKSLKSNGKYRYMWLYKGQFTLPEDSYATQEDKPKAQTSTIKATFVKRLSDDAWEVVADEDSTGFVETTATNWFTSVYSGTV